MFRFQVIAFQKAESRVRRHHDRDGYYIVIEDQRITASTTDEKQADIWQQVLTVHFALMSLGHTPRREAGLLASNAYSAFARELELYHA